ncbi:MAG: hypothetical protein F4Y49_15325 [Dehalococcoidia bacterium]|nr:hypothetical protein [Dehalococcoidia bacterium]
MYDIVRLNKSPELRPVMSAITVLTLLTMLCLSCGRSQSSPTVSTPEPAVLLPPVESATPTPQSTNSLPTPSGQASVPMSPVPVETSTPTPTPIPVHGSPTLTPADPQSGSAPVHAAGIPYTGETSLEERAALHEVVARVRLRSVTTTVELIMRNPLGDTAYAGALEFRFEVLEYLAGSGGSEIVGVGYESKLFDTQAEARATLPGLLASRDTRWDDREAIVFFERALDVLPSSAQEGRYLLGGLGFGGYSHSPDSFTIASPYNKGWLPSASSGGASGAVGTSTSTINQLFLMDDPTKASYQGASGTTGASGATGSVPTITLSELRTRIGAVDTEVQNGNGSEEYRSCVWYKHYKERNVRRELATKGTVYLRIDRELTSGLPAGSTIYRDQGGLAMGYPPANLGRYWLEGRDKDLFVAQAVDPQPKDWWGNGVINSVVYSRELSTARPLPVGEYKFYFEALPAERVVCSGQVELARNSREWFINIVAPAGTLHEAFFDPVLDTSTSAVGADSTNGVLKPSVFTDSGGATTTIGSLEWESGTVKMNVSPHTALDGQVLDFIKLDGTVSLSLYTADATTDAANNTLNWSVASQPWEDGDTLMLRIRRGPNRPPVFDSSTYAFTVREDASAFHVIGFVSATDPDVGDDPWYYITGGNEAGRFQLGANNGELLVWKSLDYETASSYTLSVEARDGRENGTTTATVEISVTDVDE